MHWRNKAKIMKTISYLPYSEEFYRFVQKYFGRLKVDPMHRIPQQVEMSRMLLKHGMRVDGKTIFEVGTGNEMIIPIGFFLAGAEEVITVDLNERLDLGIFKKSLMWFVDNKDLLTTLYNDITNHSIFNKRLNLIDRLKHDPLKLLLESNIKYLAPADASKINLNNSIIDYHISNMVLEHIPNDNICNIMKEAKRILKKNGTALHFIDLSDHFQHQDPAISKINFLKYSEKEWLSIAGNNFAYCNRLRASDYEKLFISNGFNILDKVSVIDPYSNKLLLDCFPIHDDYKQYDINDISITKLIILAFND